jgi:hypothetical protein
VIHVKDIAGNRAPYALTFADAVKRFGTKLEEDDLGEAYRRAGRNFEGQLSQLFVVLKEDPDNQRILAPRATGGLQRGTGRGNGAPRGGGQNRGRGNYRGSSRGFSYGQGRSHQDRGKKRIYEEQPHVQNHSQQSFSGSRGYSVKRQNVNN